MVDGTKSQAYSVVLNRVGRVMNVVDVTQPSEALAISAVAKALAAGQQGSVWPGRGRLRSYPLRQAAGRHRSAGISQGSWLPVTSSCWAQAGPVDSDRNRAAKRGVQRIPVREKRQLGNRLGKIEELEGLPDPGQRDEVLRPGRDRADDQGRQGQ